ncbi:MAG: class I SAM-dependent methyltransferase [Burkholderiales bacterium]
MTSGDTGFAGSIPQLYDRYLVPLIFAPYAVDIAARAGALRPASVLEIAAGTGAVTRELARALPASTGIVATDLNPPMLDQAMAAGTARPVTFQVADAMKLPFDDASFDAVVCQLGAMFFPGKPAAFREARRVLRPGGALLFSVWDRIENNDFAQVVTEALAGVFPYDPPRFMARTPHGYHDTVRIGRDVTDGGFVAPEIITIEARSRAGSPRDVAIAYCQGTPLRNEIESRDSSGLARATDVAEAAIAKRFGHGAVDGRISAHVVVARC